ncbi:MAG: hypothetical protein JXI43_10345 [Tissierellales bacterium]|nr:hypothetical protein [Tissierellales bacterium]
MAKNKPYGDNRRKGAVRKRVQVKNPKTKHYVKINTSTNRFIDNKAKKNSKFKGVRKLKKRK